MNLEVRRARRGDSDDAQAIVALLNAYAEDPKGGSAPLSEDVRRRLVPALEAHPTALVLLAFVDGEPAGIAVCFVGLSTFNALPLLNIHDLAVRPEFRGAGLGRALLEEAEVEARERGCCKLTLEVQEDNDRARSVYRAFGFDDFVLGDSGPTRFLSKALAPA